METVLCSRSAFSSTIRVIAGKFFTILSSTDFYIFGASSEENKICIKLKEISTHYDFLYSPTGTYICYASDNGSLYAFKAPFFSIESQNLERGWNVVKPDFHENIWKSSSAFELLAIDSKNEMIWLLESLTGRDKALSCYHIRCSNNNFKLHLLGLCNYKSSEYVHNDKITRNGGVKTYFLISHSIAERLNFGNSTIDANDRHVQVSDSLFVNLFGGRNNLECQLIVMMCFPDGIIQWFPGSSAASPGMTVSLLWNMQDEVVNIHSVLVKSLNRKGVSEETNCLVIIGKGGSIIILGMQQYPSNLQFQVYCEINASGIFGDNLLFSTSNGIYTLCLSDIMKDADARVIPSLISSFRVNSFIVCPETINAENVKMFACLDGNRVVKFSLSLIQEDRVKGQHAMSKMKIKQTMAAIESTTKQNIAVKNSCNNLSNDFSTLCISTYLSHDNKFGNNLIVSPSSSEVKAETLFPKLNINVHAEYQCISVMEQLYSISISLHSRDDRLRGRDNYSCVVHIVPSLVSNLFPKSISKSSKINYASPKKGENCTTLVCSMTLTFYLSSTTLPLNVLTLLSVGFDPVGQLPPLLIPLKKFEVGILKFVSLTPQKHLNRHHSSTDALDILKLKCPRNMSSTLPDTSSLSSEPEWDSIRIPLKRSPVPGDIGLWNILFDGNNIQNVISDSPSIEVFMRNIDIRLQLMSSSSGLLLTISSTSMQVLPLLHQEILLILYKGGHLSISEKSIFPILQISDVKQPPAKLLKLDSDEVLPMDCYQRLVQCYKMCRNS